jgi:two-component system, OmpR family, sensor histidine kinase TctE
MAIMRTQLALASRAKKEAERRAAIAAADNAVEHAERVLAQLLLLARIDEAASDKLRLETIDLAALAKAQTAELVPRANAAGIDLGYEGAESAMMRGDAMLLGELLRNLIENAIAYAGQGAEATVAVRADADGLRLSVADTGPGVAATKLPALRKRFARERTEKPGAGLGLAIVEEIAALFGGTTEVVSDSGQGFRVTIALPG